jgi:hypothetical protein
MLADIFGGGSTVVTQ